MQLPSLYSLSECIDAAELCEEINWIGLKQDQFSDAAGQSRRSLHGNRPAERMTNEINLARLVWQRGFDETCLIVK